MPADIAVATLVDSMGAAQVASTVARPADFTAAVVDFMVAGAAASTAVADTGNSSATQHDKARSSERAFVFSAVSWRRT
jgi:hypothetical protein